MENMLPEEAVAAARAVLAALDGDPGLEADRRAAEAILAGGDGEPVRFVGSRTIARSDPDLEEFYDRSEMWELRVAPDRVELAAYQNLATLMGARQTDELRYRSDGGDPAVLPELVARIVAEAPAAITPLRAR